MSCATGYKHSATLTDGIVYSFGFNYYGQLGLTHNTDVPIPSSIPNLPKIKMVACGQWFTVCVDSKGFIWTFGKNNYGQLGTGNYTNYNIPQKIKQISSVKSISCGSNHTLIITNNSKLWSFGANSFGQLCLKNQENQIKPQRTQFSNVAKISAGCNFSLFQNFKGEIFGCGFNEHGNLALGHNHHPQVKICKILNLPDNIDQFCSGVYHSLILDSKGNVFSVGLNSYGSLGLSHNKNVNVLQQIPNIPPIQTISCVGASSYLLDFDGNVWSFGDNHYGQLGHGDIINRNIPTKINQNNFKQLASGCCGNHFLAKNSQDKVIIMGSNDYRQLGTKKCKTFPIPAEIDEKFSKIWGEQSIDQFETIIYSWKSLSSMETMNWKEEEIEKLQNLQCKIEKVKSNLKSNNNLSKKQEFPQNSFENWAEVYEFLNGKFKEINSKLIQKQENDNQINNQIKEFKNELKNITNQLQKLQSQKHEIEEKMKKAKQTKNLIEDNYQIIEDSHRILNDMSSDVLRFCENENQMNKEIEDLFNSKKFENFDCEEISKLLWKMDLTKYQQIFEDNQINGEIALMMTDDCAVCEEMGLEKRDYLYILFCFEMMNTPGYYTTLSSEYEENCVVCCHNTPEKTIYLLREYEIPIEDNLILENSYRASILTLPSLLKEILGNDFLSKGLQIMKEITKWKKIHKKHLKQLRDKSLKRKLDGFETSPSKKQKLIHNE